MTATVERMTADELLRMPDDGFCSASDIRRLGEGEVLEGGEVVPGWKLPLEELFA